MKLLYRYEDVSYESGPKIQLCEFYVAAETPKGHWISTNFYFTASELPANFPKDRWVPKEGVNVYARTTKETALNDFKCRKIRHRNIMQSKLLELEMIFDLLNDGEYK